MVLINTLASDLMIDKDKLIELTECFEEEYSFSRDQIDWLCENQERFCGPSSNPYEIRIDFSSIVIDMMAKTSELRQRVENLEILARVALPKESAELMRRETCPTGTCCGESSSQLL